MLRRIQPAVVVFLLVGTLSAAAPSGHRVALLIGNSEYDGVELKGTAASLDLVGKSLENLGFSVERHENLDEKQKKEVAETFAKSVPTNGVAVVYCVGLGAHVERGGTYHNLLRPVGTAIKNEGEYRSKGLNLGEMIESLNLLGGGRTHVVLIDACWDSPIKPTDAKVRPGMREFDAPVGVSVLLGAASEQVVTPPETDGPTPLAAAFAKHAGEIENSLEDGLGRMAEDLGGAWFTSIEAGIGERGEFAVVDSPSDTAEAGDAYVNSAGMSFRWCPPGDFRMGSDDTDSAATRDRKPVDVTLTRGFWMGEYEVTQREYKALRGRDVGRGFTSGPGYPYWGANEVKSVEEICKILNEREKKAGRLPDGWAYVCPTEAEWEYACRAGSTAAYCFGDDRSQLGEYGNVADAALHAENPNYYWAERRTDDGVGEALAPVGSYLPNAWGLRDMHGNVAEIVADHYVEANRPGGRDPFVRVEKNGQTQIRGGAWCSLPEYCESSFRNAYPARDKSNYVGFRIALKKVR